MNEDFCNMYDRLYWRIGQSFGIGLTNSAIVIAEILDYAISVPF